MNECKNQVVLIPRSCLLRLGMAPLRMFYSAYKLCDIFERTKQILKLNPFTEGVKSKVRMSSKDYADRSDTLYRFTACARHAISCVRFVTSWSSYDIITIK